MPAKMTLLPGHSTKLSVSTEDDSSESMRHFEIVFGYMKFFCICLKIWVCKFYEISWNYHPEYYAIFIDILNINDYVINSFNTILSLYRKICLMILYKKLSHDIMQNNFRNL